MPTELAPQTKQVLQKAALQLRQYENRDKPEIKALSDALDAMTTQMNRQRRELQKLQIEMQGKARELRNAVMPLIAEELRD